MPLNREWKIASYAAGAGAIGRAGMHKAKALNTAATAAKTLSSAFGKMEVSGGASAKKRGGGGGGGGGSSATGSQPDEVVMDSGGKPFVSEMNTSDAFTTSAAYKSNDSRVDDEAFDALSIEELKAPGVIDGLMANKAKRGQPVWGMINNSEYVSGRHKTMIKGHLEKDYFATQDRLHKKRTSVLAAHAESEIETNSTELYAPQYADPNVDAQDVWENNEFPAIAANPHIGHIKTESNLSAAMVSASENYLSRFTFADAHAMLNGKYKGDEKLPAFLGKLDKAERDDVRKHLVEEQKVHTNATVRAIDEATVAHNNRDPRTAEEDQSVENMVLKNDDPKVRKAVGEFRVAKFVAGIAQDKTTAELRVASQQLRAKIATGKGTHEERIALAGQADALDKAIANEEKLKASDPHGYDVKKGWALPTELKTDTAQGFVETIDDRLSEARRGNDKNPGRDKAYLNPGEAPGLLKLYRKGDPLFFRAVIEKMGPDAVPFLKSLAGKDGNTADARTMVAVGEQLSTDPDNPAAMDTLEYKRRKYESDKGGSRPLKLVFETKGEEGREQGLTARRALVKEEVGASAHLEAIGHQADMIMSLRVMDGKIEWSKENYKAIVREIKGEVTVGDKTYGGVATGAADPSGLGNWRAYRFDVPQAVEQQYAAEVFKSVKPKTFPKGIPVTGPNSPNPGAPMTDNQWEEAVIVSTSNGDYKIFEAPRTSGDAPLDDAWKNPKTGNDYRFTWEDIEREARRLNKGRVR